MALVFAANAAVKLGGDPAVVEVDADVDQLAAEPTYLRLRAIAPSLPPLTNPTWEDSLHECGRVVSGASVDVLRTWTCSDATSLAVNLQRAGLLEHLELWTDPEGWRKYAQVLRVKAESWEDYRNAVGRRILEQLFDENS